MTIASLAIGMRVRVRYSGVWYLAAVEKIGRTRATVVFMLRQQSRGLRRLIVRAEKLRPWVKED